MRHSDSRWTHPVCSSCYADFEPDRDPHVVVDADRETCCGCGEPTEEGIYYRADPRDMQHCPQKGKH